MKKILLLTLTMIAIQMCGQKDIKKYVANHTTLISTIEPDSTNFSDLEEIGKAIGDSRIVMLGEQDHGDAPTFLAKTRLIKYLHKEKGFDVIAFESDFFALNEGWDRLEKQKVKIDTFLRNNIFQIWTDCRQCEKLFYTYVSGSFDRKSPIAITGFDSQIHGKYSENLKIYVDNLLMTKQIPFLQKNNDRSDFLSFITSSRINKNQKKIKLFINQLDTIIKLLPTNTSSFDRLMLKSMKENAKSDLSFLLKRNDYMELRDKQMAENLKWIVNTKYPNRKVIVWAHNVHILKNKELIKPSIPAPTYFDNWTSMGQFFVSDPLLNQQTYIMGFNSKRGKAGRINYPQKYELMPPAKDGFENWFPNETNYAFVDFKKYRESYPESLPYFNMKGKYHVNNEAVWTSVFDGIFYIKDMYPCDKIK